MTKDIKDYLHLYLGQYVYDDLNKRTFILDQEEVYNYFDDDEGEYLNDIKPLLRPLSDMTEEEKLKLYGFGFTCNEKGLQIKEPKKWQCFNPKQFQYLLSRGFDLFGLIESGLAIDKTKLQNP